LGIAANQLSSLDLRPMIAIDAEIPLSSLNGKTFKMMQKLAPFGSDNPYPTFISRGIGVIKHRSVGADGKHLKFKLKDGDTTWDGIAFRLGNLSDEITPQLDIVYNLEVDRWGGGEMLQLKILDFTPAT
ncbi:MAG: single-stranded-DNA-specific exonuclease RecJ, partial [Dehalococcoidia bacterium]